MANRRADLTSRPHQPTSPTNDVVIVRAVTPFTFTVTQDAQHPLLLCLARRQLTWYRPELIEGELPVESLLQRLTAAAEESPDHRPGVTAATGGEHRPTLQPRQMVLGDPTVGHERSARIVTPHLVDELVEFPLRAHPPIMNVGYDSHRMLSTASLRATEPRASQPLDISQCWSHGAAGLRSSALR